LLHSRPDTKYIRRHGTRKFEILDYCDLSCDSCLRKFFCIFKAVLTNAGMSMDNEGMNSRRSNGSCAKQ
jgi:hypothetical protein